MSLKAVWLAALLACFAVGARAQVAPLNSVAAASTPATTDTLVVCQNPVGCGAGDSLKFMPWSQFLGTQWLWGARQGINSSVLTDGSTIAVNAALTESFTLALTADGHHLGNPTGLTGNVTGELDILITQPASGCPSGGCQLVFDGTNTFWQSTGGVGNLVLSKTPGATDGLYCKVWSSTFSDCSVRQNISGVPSISVSHADGCIHQDTGTTATSLTCTLAGSTLAGQSGVVFLASHFPAGVSVTTVKDNSGDVCTAPPGATQSGGAGWAVYGYVCQNLSAGATSFTVTFSGTNTFGFETIGVETFNGLKASGAIVDGNPAGNDQTSITTATDFITSGPLAPTVNGDMSVGFTFLVGSPAALTAGTGYTLGHSVTNQAATEYQALSSAAAVSDTFTAGTGGQEAITLAFALEP